jgi:hypothetical protein
MDWLPLLSVQDHTRRSGAEQRDDPKPMASMTPNKKGQDNESNALEMSSCNSSFWDFLFAQGALHVLEVFSGCWILARAFWEPIAELAA